MNKNSQSVTQILDNLPVKDLKIITDFLQDSAYRKKDLRWIKKNNRWIKEDLRWKKKHEW